MKEAEEGGRLVYTTIYEPWEDALLPYILSVCKNTLFVIFFPSSCFFCLILNRGLEDPPPHTTLYAYAKFRSRTKDRVGNMSCHNISHFLIFFKSTIYFPFFRKKWNVCGGFRKGVLQRHPSWEAAYFWYIIAWYNKERWSLWWHDDYMIYMITKW